MDLIIKPDLSQQKRIRFSFLKTLSNRFLANRCQALVQTCSGELLTESIPKLCVRSPVLSDSRSGGTGLWYTGCYINEEDACLTDQIQGITPFLSDSQTFPDAKALTMKNVTVGIFCQNWGVFSIESFH